MNTTILVAQFKREVDEAYGSDKAVKVYKVTSPAGHTWFTVSLFENEQLQSCAGEYISYGFACAAGIKWLDNSDFYI